MEEQEQTTEEKKTFFKPKMVSLFGKIISGTVVLGGFILRWTGVMPNAEPKEIVICGLVTLGIICGTIDVNIMLDKFTGK